MPAAMPPAGASARTSSVTGGAISRRIEALAGTVFRVTSSLKRTAPAGGTRWTDTVPVRTLAVTVSAGMSAANLPAASVVAVTGVGTFEARNSTTAPATGPAGRVTTPVTGIVWAAIAAA